MLYKVSGTWYNEEKLAGEFTVEDLRDLASELNIKGYTKLTKDDLVTEIRKKLEGE